ncbi:hypothetical protein I4U23_005953 [Adineta vaga]|nr:hypothetical protein I4U23_005953 [Adineta vaga]
MEFSDLYDGEEYASWEHVYEYLCEYADKFNLKSHIRLYSRVISISKINLHNPDESWCIKIESISKNSSSSSSSSIEIFNFDFVVVASGLFSQYRMPNFRGQEKFLGSIVHSNEIKTRDQLINKNILVIGGGKSAIDMAINVATVSNRCDMIFRRIYVILPLKILHGYLSIRYMFTCFQAFISDPYPLAPHGRLFRLAHRYFENILLKIRQMIAANFTASNAPILYDDGVFRPRYQFKDGILSFPVPTIFTELKGQNRIQGHIGSIEEIIDSKTIRLDNGKVFNSVDMIICSTGHYLRFPFFSDDDARTMGLPYGQSNDLDLYRRLVPIDVPNIAFIGYISSSGTWMIDEVAAHWISDYFHGMSLLPSRIEMQNEIKIIRDFIRNRFGVTAPHTRTYWLELIEIYLQDMRLPLRRTNNWWTENFGVYRPNRLKKLHEQRQARDHDWPPFLRKFEDLANEVFYEIFEYLEYYHIYQSFFNLNLRFHSLLIQSTVPIKIVIFHMSKSAFNRFNQDIIQPTTHRIQTLRIINCFMYDECTLALSQKTSLQTLILENIEPKCLKNLLLQLTSLPYLSSLSISTLGGVEEKTSVYRRIFRLSTLKYCKLSLGNELSSNILSLATNKYSSIEHLIIENHINENELQAILSYVPQLRHLSLHSFELYKRTRKQLSSIMLEFLTHVSLKFDYPIEFNDFEQFLVKYFPLIQVLHITMGNECMPANRWEQLISTYLTNLRIFDVRFKICLENDSQINQFTSPFWIERQWFFDYVRYQCFYYFPYVTKLTLTNNLPINTYESIVTSLTHILPLEQLKTLIIQSIHLSFMNMIKLIIVIPNLQTLSFRRMLLSKDEKIIIEQNEIFRSISNTNRIINVTFEDECTLEELKLLVLLCPHLQHLAFRTQLKHLESILRFLLNKNNKNTRHLISLSLIYANVHYFKDVNRILKFGTLPRTFRITPIYNDLYLWW